MSNYLSNAFSLQMVPANCIIHTAPVEAEDVPTDCISCIGHASTAAVTSTLLGREIPANRVSIALTPTDTLYVVQYRGPRLEEGVTVLPAGASLSFQRVELVDLASAIEDLRDPYSRYWGEAEWAQAAGIACDKLEKLMK